VLGAVEHQASLFAAAQPRIGIARLRE